jgi:hypothetical protein
LPALSRPFFLSTALTELILNGIHWRGIVPTPHNSTGKRAHKKLFLLTLLLIPTAAFADSILYTFSTTSSTGSGVTGSFTLDDSAPFVFTGQALWRYGGFAPTPIFGYYAATPFLSGTYGAYTLSATDSGILPSNITGLHISDFQPPYDAAWEQARSDEWIFRANVSSDVLNGRSVTGFAILGYGSMDSLNGPGYNPPSVTGLGIQRSQVLVGFSDGSSEALILSSLTLVPEVPSLALLPIGLLGILLVYRPKRAQSCCRASEFHSDDSK